jgi:hypothetical protein
MQLQASDIDTLTPLSAWRAKVLTLFPLRAYDVCTFSSHRLWCWHFFVSAPMMLALFLRQRLWRRHFFAVSAYDVGTSSYDVGTFSSSTPMMLALFRLSDSDVCLSQRLRCWHLYTFICRPKVLALFSLSILTLLHRYLQAKVLRLFSLSAFDIDTFTPTHLLDIHLVAQGIGTFSSQRLWYWHF